MKKNFEPSMVSKIVTSVMIASLATFIIYILSPMFLEDFKRAIAVKLILLPILIGALYALLKLLTQRILIENDQIYFHTIFTTKVYPLSSIKSYYVHRLTFMVLDNNFISLHTGFILSLSEDNFFSWVKANYDQAYEVPLDLYVRQPYKDFMIFGYLELLMILISVFLVIFEDG